MASKIENTGMTTINEIGPELCAFYKELKDNNNKDWFHSNKARYHDEVYQPFYSFIESLIVELIKMGIPVEVTPKQSIFRINKDIRFSKDKTPYKLHSSALITFGGSKSKKKPSLYTELRQKEFVVKLGIFKMTSSQFNSINSNKNLLSDLIHNSKYIWHLDLESNTRMVVIESRMSTDGISSNNFLITKCLDFLNDEIATLRYLLSID